MDMQYVKLNNGIEMPQVGLGTFLIPKDKLEDTLIKAYDMGYRQFDSSIIFQHGENGYQSIDDII